MKSVKRQKTAIDLTYEYLENYKEMECYLKEAISEGKQIADIDMYNISAESAYLGSIRDCKAETVILHAHITKALDLLEKEAVERKEEYKYRAMIMRCIDGKTFEEIQEELQCGKGTPQKWCAAMIRRLAIKLFGAKAITPN